MIYLTLQVNQSVDISSNIDYSVGIISVIFYQCKYLLVIQQSISVQNEVMSLNHSLALYLNDIANFWLVCSPYSLLSNVLNIL